MTIEEGLKMKMYKIMERVWFCNGNYSDEYVEKFDNLKKAKAFVKNNEKEWKKDLEEYSETGVDVFIEVWEDNNFIEDETFIAWCENK